jgi:lysophospholipase L1-like esterase
MKNLKNYLFALLTLVFITACDEDTNLIQEQLDQNPLPPPQSGDSGDLDLTKYVSIGNSIAAGYQDRALYTNAQVNSFPTYLARQMQISGIGGGDFNQPDINSANGFSSPNPNPSNGLGNYLGRLELSLSLLRPVPTAGELPTPFGGDKAALNNFAVPGMKMGDATDPALAINNPLYGRFASSPGTSTVLGDALAANPSFFTFELGANDVLGYAVSGGLSETQITDPATFQAQLTNNLGALIASGAEGIVSHVPMIITAPFFRAVPYNAVPLTSQGLVDQLNGAFAGLNQVLDGLAANQLITPEEAAKRKVVYALGANPILMFDDALEDLGPKFDLLGLPPATRAALQPFVQSRPAILGDLVLLTAATEIGREIIPGNASILSGISYPIGDGFMLTQVEWTNVVTARATYNAIIAGVVAGLNANAGATVLAEFDVNVIMTDLSGLSTAQATQLGHTAAAIAAADGVLGIIESGVSLAPDFSPNGVFSTDGIHPNPRGHGLFTNGIIDVMNSVFSASIPHMNVLALRGILATE